jgi:hypothetical protein
VGQNTKNLTVISLSMSEFGKSVTGKSQKLDKRPYFCSKVIAFVPVILNHVALSLTLSLLMSYIYIYIYIYMELLVKPEILTHTHTHTHTHIYIYIYIYIYI